MEETVNNGRNSDGTFAKGNPGGPGRPPGKTLKEFAREFYMLKTDEEKREYLAKVEEKRPGFAWQMAEGNPASSTDITTGGEKLPETVLVRFLDETKDNG